MLGVVTTELTVNAHAYLVTFIAGPGPFALLALGMLLMRPAALMQSALPDLERPLMTRQIAARDWRGLERTRRDFGFGLMAALLATLVLDAALLIWAPQLVLKKGYDLHEVVIVTSLCALIMAVRALRTPQAVHLQAAGLFKQLAMIGSVSSIVSLLSVLALLIRVWSHRLAGGRVPGRVCDPDPLPRAWRETGGHAMAERVIVAIPTFRRPKNLQRLLEALAKLDTDAEVSVLVADNDADHHEGFDFCNKLAPYYRWPLKSVIARQRGIAHARNTLVAEALKDEKAGFIAMIDDDEWPDPHWISAFLKAQRPERRRHAARLHSVWRSKRRHCPGHPPGAGAIAMLQGAGNLFMARARLAAMTPPWFDPAFALQRRRGSRFLSAPVARRRPLCLVR